MEGYFKGGCFTELIGKKGGRQLLNLDQYSDHCWEHGTIIHELMHVLGFFHEQSRLDRDKYVVVHWNKLPKSLHFQYWTTKDLGYDYKDVGKYDFGSVMHYSRYLGFKLALSARLHSDDYERQAEENDMMGQRTEPSDKDTNKLNALYCSDLLANDKKQNFRERASYINCSNLTPLMKSSLDEKAKCCGPTFYNTESHECCYGHVFPLDPTIKSSTKTTFQCDRKRKKENCISHDCCNERIVPLAPGLPSSSDENAGCCRDVSINHTTHGCCKTYSAVYRSKFVVFRLESPISKTTTKIYDKATKMCCDQQIVPLVSLAENGTAHCCKNVSYNYTTRYCCDDEVVTLADGLYLYPDNRNYVNARCCGNVSYNIHTHDCCQKFHRDGSYLGLLNVVPLAPGIQKWATNKECCGSVAVNTDTHGCCKYVPYNKSENYCCKGTVVPLGPGLDPSLKDYYKSDKDCCGYISYNTITHDCCYGNVVPLSPWTEEEGKIGRSDECCKNASYNARIDDCCQDKVVPRAIRPQWQDRTSCCGHVSIYRYIHSCCEKIPYHYTTEACCRTENSYLVVPLASGLNSSYLRHALCCGPNSYNSRTHQCCEKQIVAPAPGKASELYCCRNVSYNIHTHDCCQDNVVVKPYVAEMDSGCCGSVSYYPHTHTCCEKKVVPLPHGLKSSRNAECCANNSYDPVLILVVKRKWFLCRLVQNLHMQSAVPIFHTILLHMFVVITKLYYWLLVCLHLNPGLRKVARTFPTTLLLMIVVKKRLH